MSFFLVWTTIGVLMALAFAWGGRLLNREHLLFGVSLLLTAAWYVCFGFIENIESGRLIPQIFGGLCFGGFAVLGIRGSFLWLSIGWLSHFLWDPVSAIYLGATYVPDFTLPICVGFDLVAGAYLMMRHFGKLQPEGTSTKLGTEKTI